MLIVYRQLNESLNALNRRSRIGARCFRGSDSANRHSCRSSLKVLIRMESDNRDGRRIPLGPLTVRSRLSTRHQSGIEPGDLLSGIAKATIWNSPDSSSRQAKTARKASTPIAPLVTLRSKRSFTRHSRISTFMVLVNNLCQRPGRFHILQHFVSAFRVFFNQRKFNVCQLGRFGQYFRGYG